MNQEKEYQYPITNKSLNEEGQWCNQTHLFGGWGQAQKILKLIGLEEGFLLC